MGSNKYVQIAAIVLVLVAILLGIKTCKSDSSPQSGGAVTPGGGQPLSDEAMAGLGIEGDTERDTVATVTAEMKGLREDLATLVEENDALRSDNEKLLDMEESIGRRVEGKLEDASSSVEQEAKRQYDDMVVRLEEAEQRLQGLMQRASRQEAARKLAPTSTGETVWIQPLGRSGEVGEGDSDGGFLSSLENVRSDASDRIGLRNLPGLNRQREEEPMIPFYTIPKNATLVSSTAMTALIGRVPFAGQVTDPYSFKVIIGRENLMANGIELPEVSYAIASGKAVGDWTLGCVRGDLFSLTFVFEDGTIRTVPKPSDVYEGTASKQDIKLGEISDQFGNPCVLGQRITNAVQYLSQRIGVVSVQAAAEAAAASQTTQITSVGCGGAGIATVVDGSTGEFILGQSIADSANEIAEWLDERQSQQFDAIYVAPGANVSMHITEQIEIDYDPQGRRTNQAASLGGGYRELP
ncbi:MAG: TIGR03752 family integrating conjugative element protein [Pseudomonadota bacterium]